MIRAVKTAAIIGGRMVIVLVATVLGLASGCGGAPQRARVAIAITTQGVDAADIATAAAITIRGESCREANESEAGYMACTANIRAAKDGIVTARSSLRSVEAGADAWDAGDEGGSFFSAAPCLAETVSHLLSALGEAGVDLPVELQESIGLLGAFGGTCHGQ